MLAHSRKIARLNGGEISPTKPRPSTYLFILSFMSCTALLSSGSICAGPSLKSTLLIVPVIVFAFLFVIGTKLALSRPSGFAIPLAALIMLLGAICMIVTQRHDYGAYKFLCIGWFLFALLIVEGLVWSSSGLKGDRPRAAVVLGLLLLLLPQTVLLGLRLHRFDASRPIKDMGYFRSVSKIQGVVGDAPVLVSSGSFLGSIQEPDKNPLLRAEAFEWVVLFLRGLNMIPIGYDHPYFLASWEQASYLDRLQKVVGKDAFLLSDQPYAYGCNEEALQVGLFRLYRLSATGWVIPGAFSNPNGSHEISNGVPMVWIGDEPARWSILSSFSGPAVLDAVFSMGPSLPESDMRTLEITTNSGLSSRVIIRKAGRQKVSIPIFKGVNQIRLRVVEHASLSKVPNGDNLSLLTRSPRVFAMPWNTPMS